MKRILLTALMIISVAFAQKMKYVVAYCTLQQAGTAAPDTVFHGNEGSITSLVDLTDKTLSFDWKTKEFNTIKKYTIVEEKTIKEDIYNTMGIYSRKLKCLNKDGKQCTVEFAISERINKIDIVVVDGSFVLNYSAVEVQL